VARGARTGRGPALLDGEEQGAGAKVEEDADGAGSDGYNTLARFRPDGNARRRSSMQAHARSMVGSPPETPRRFCWALSVCCLLTGLSVAAPAQEPEQKPSDKEKVAKAEFPVTMDVVAGRRDAEGKQRIVVTLTIKKGHHIYANPTGNRDFDEVKSILRVEGKNIAKDVAITYPKGEVVKDQVIGDFWIYTGKVQMEAVVQRQTDEDAPLTVTVRLYPHNDAGCFWRITLLKKSVP
jgi:hypothetical protein